MPLKVKKSTFPHEPLMLAFSKSANKNLLRKIFTLQMTVFPPDNVDRYIIQKLFGHQNPYYISGVKPKSVYNKVGVIFIKNVVFIFITSMLVSVLLFVIEYYSFFYFSFRFRAVVHLDSALSSDV